MDFRFLYFEVKKFNWDEINRTLFFECLYQDRERVKLEFVNPKNVKYLEILPSRVIEYITRIEDEGSDVPCFEIKCKDIYETAFVWADYIQRV